MSPALLLHEAERVALGVGDRRDGRPGGKVDGVGEDGPPELDRLLEGGLQVAHLHVEDARALLPGRPRSRAVHSARSSPARMWQPGPGSGPPIPAGMNMNGPGPISQLNIAL